MQFEIFTSDAFCNLVPFVQFKKCEKHPWRSVTFEACNFIKSNTPPWVFFTFSKLYKLHQIKQSVAYFFCHSFSCIQQMKIFQSWNSPRERKVGPTKYLRDFRPTKYWREQFWTHKIPTRKNFGLTKYPWEKFGPAKYLREKISDPQNTHERRDGIRIVRSTMTGDPKKPQHTRFCSRNIKFYLTS